jgi:S-DNA-T family DNA segregation ATPase FtsK/SpoIIIE
MDIMEEKGIVGPADGAKPRGILMSQEQFNRFYGK